MYFPHTVKDSHGPTGILPGYQHTDELSSYDADVATETELGLSVPAGTVALINHDSWHRQTWNSGDERRIMCKFHYERVEEPSPAAGAPSPPADWGTDAVHPRLRNEPMWRSTWRWMHGAEQPPAQQGEGEAAEAAGLLAAVEVADRKSVV